MDHADRNITICGRCETAYAMGRDWGKPRGAGGPSAAMWQADQLPNKQGARLDQAQGHLAAQINAMVINLLHGLGPAPAPRKPSKPGGAAG